MAKRQNEQGQKQTMNWVLGLALLFLAVILAVNAVSKAQNSAVFSAVIGFLGAALFGGVSLSLLAGELRQRLRKHK